MIVRREESMEITDHYVCLYRLSDRTLDECHAAAERFASLVGIAPEDYTIERRPERSQSEILFAVREGVEVDSDRWRRVWELGEWQSERSKTT